MIVLGRVSAPFGIKGSVRIHAFGDDPLSWGKIRRWWLGSEAEWRAYEVSACVAHKTGLVASLKGIADRTAAEALVGLYVAAPREDLPANAADEYYWSDLIGLNVVNESGNRLGRVTDLITSGAHEVLCVSDGEQISRLLPFVGHVVKQVDLGAGVIRVDWQLDW